MAASTSSVSNGREITEATTPVDLIVGIDFGTAFSGFSYAVAPGGRLAQRGIGASGQVFCHEDWPAAHFPYPKTPTALLYNNIEQDDGTHRPELLAWGCEAQNQVAALSADQVSSQGPYMLFENFKLHLEPRSDAAQRTGPLPHGWRVEKLVCDYLRELRKYAMKELRDEFETGDFLLDPAAIRWCLTVPALWSEPAKDTMRSAAAMAGLSTHRSASVSVLSPSARLLLTLEPEAAALAALHAGSHTATGTSAGGPSTSAAAGPQLSAGTDALRDGDVVLVVDVGGGTSDITAHKVKRMDLTGGSAGGDSQALCLEEAVAGSGEFHAGLAVDGAFDQLCRKKFTNWHTWSESHKSELHAFMRRWQDVKRAWSGDNAVQLTAPEGLRVRAAQPPIEGWTTDIEVHADVVDDYQSVSLILPAQSLLVTREEMALLYDPTVDAIVAQTQAVKDAAANNRMSCNKVLLAGGFCCSPYVQGRLQDALGGQGCSVIVLQRPASAVVEGAVHFARQPGAISARRARYAYGVRTASLLTPQMEDALGAALATHAFQHAEDGEMRVRGVFSRYVKRGELLPSAHEVVRFYSPLSSIVAFAEIVLFQSTENDALFTFDDSMTELATVVLPLPRDWASSSAWRQERFYPIECRMRFGLTALEVMATDLQTGQQVETRVEFRSVERTSL